MRKVRAMKKSELILSRSILINFMNNIDKKDILNTLIWFELYKNKIVYDLILLGCYAARNMSQPSSLVGGNKKGLDLVDFLRKLEINKDFFKISFINILKSMQIMVTNPKIKIEILQMK